MTNRVIEQRTPTPAANEPASRLRRCVPCIPLGLLVLLYVLLLLRTAWLTDDAFITYRSVGNFVSGYGLTWNIDERVQAYTHPLWMFLVSGLFCVTASITFSAFFASIVSSVAAVLVFAFGVARGIPQAILGLAILLFSKAFIDYSTGGLENPLSHLLLALFLWLYLKDPSLPPRRLWQLSLLAGLLVLNRMDLLLLVAPALAHAFWERRGLQSLGLVLLGFVPFLAWELFSIVYYGLAFPNTAYAKLNTGMPGGVLIGQGFHYLANSLHQDHVTLPAIACAVIAAMISRQGRKVSLAGGIMLYMLYTIKIGGDFMSGRFFAAPLFVAAAILVTLPLRPRFAVIGASIGVLGTLVLGLSSPNPSLLTNGDYGLKGDGLVAEHGIADERGYYYIFTGLRRSHPKLGHAALQRAKTAREGTQTVVVNKDTLGLFGYYVGPNIHIVDLYALADPLLARLPARPNPKWRIGHFERDIPAGYIESLQSGRNEIVDPRIRQLYDDILLVTRGPLFTCHRWAAIWRLNISR